MDMRNIKVLGIGSSKYRILMNNLRKAVQELGIDVEIEKIDNVEDFIRFNIVEIPALMIDDQLIAKGYAPNVEELKAILMLDTVA